MYNKKVVENSILKTKEEKTWIYFYSNFIQLYKAASFLVPAKSPS